MRGRRIITVVVLFSIMLIGSGVFASGLVNVANVPLLNTISPTQVQPLNTASVAAYPRWVIKDYPQQPINSKFWVHINISSVTNLFTWQINITWNKAILNVARFEAGNNATYILYNTLSSNHTASYQLTWVINATDNTKGNAGAADSILDSSVGAPGVSTTPWLRMVSIQFLVVGYGKTGLTISTTGTLATILLDNTGATLAFAKTDGNFDNRIPGDIVGPENPPGSGKYPPDRTVNDRDLIYLGAVFGTSDPVGDFVGPENPPGSGIYPPDGVVNDRDLIRLGANFGRTV